MYAVVETSGRQFRVAVGDIVTVDKLEAEAGSDLTLDRVLLIGGDSLTVGAPTVKGAKVQAKVIEHFLGEKRLTRKYSRRQRTRRKVGYRPAHSRIEIVGIETK